MKFTWRLIFICGVLCLHHALSQDEILVFHDGIAELRSGPIASDVGARTEYHYLPEAAPRSQWIVSTFRWTLPSSWFIQTVDGKKSIYQRAINTEKGWHPLIIAGDTLWSTYTIRCTLKPSSLYYQSGIVFHYIHDRRYSVACFEDGYFRIKHVEHGSAFRTLNEQVAAEVPLSTIEPSWTTLVLSVDRWKITARIIGGPTLTIHNAPRSHGRIGLLADAPTAFSSVRVTMSKKSFDAYQRALKKQKREEQRVQALQPQMKLWKKISTKGFGTGRNVRFGDLDNNGEIDILLGQVIHHGPKDANSELSCLTAVKLDGSIVWQIGSPDPWKTILTNDVAFQIHDIDRDGRMEVVYCMNQQLIVADGSTGRTLTSVPTPLAPSGKTLPTGHNKFERILGDCIFFCDVEGKGYPTNIILKDRYTSFWVYSGDLRILWSAQCNTGHYPHAYDIDNDGKDEILMGYTLFDDNGEKLWSHDSTLKDHADGVVIVPMKKGEQPLVLCAASDEGMIFMNRDGSIRRHYYNGHCQNPAVANFRDDLPGLEVVTVNFWGNQGIIHLYDAEGNIYHEFEPNQYGSMCLPLNWTGKTEEYFILNANVDEGGIYDGWGRRVLMFPDDGHPDMCCAALDLIGDCRDEIIVWDPQEIWIYTQTDNPKTEPLYNPHRSPLYNESNYRTNVSIPKQWSK
ncbi:MAG: hypothetical protein N3A63_08690 [Bacteroidetes bacterium]|nr:hypothetical protein [Bacteroidota bacterium]